MTPRMPRPGAQMAQGRLSAARRSKYGVRLDASGKAARTLDGHLFDSLKECKRYAELKLLQKAGEIRSLTIQPTFALMVVPLEGAGVLENINAGIVGQRRIPIGEWRADFKYEERFHGSWFWVIEDVKVGNATRTAVYRLKKRFVEALYGITIRET